MRLKRPDFAASFEPVSGAVEGSLLPPKSFIVECPRFEFRASKAGVRGGRLALERSEFQAPCLRDGQVV
jgi:hypothetical protein